MDIPKSAIDALFLPFTRSERRPWRWIFSSLPSRETTFTAVPLARILKLIETIRGNWKWLFGWFVIQGISCWRRECECVPEATTASQLKGARGPVEIGMNAKTSTLTSSLLLRIRFASLERHRLDCNRLYCSRERWIPLLRGGFCVFQTNHTGIDSCLCTIPQNYYFLRRNKIKLYIRLMIFNNIWLITFAFHIIWPHKTAPRAAIERDSRGGR